MMFHELILDICCVFLFVICNYCPLITGMFLLYRCHHAEFPSVAITLPLPSCVCMLACHIRNVCDADDLYVGVACSFADLKHTLRATYLYIYVP